MTRQKAMFDRDLIARHQPGEFDPAIANVVPVPSGRDDKRRRGVAVQQRCMLDRSLTGLGVIYRLIETQREGWMTGRLGVQFVDDKPRHRFES